MIDTGNYDHQHAFIQMLLHSSPTRDQVERALLCGVDPGVLKHHPAALRHFITKAPHQGVAAWIESLPLTNASKTPSWIVTAINHALGAGCKEVVAAFLDRGFPFRKGQLSRTPWAALPHASANGHSDLCEFLLDRGADVEDRTASMETPLMMAAQGGHVEVIRLLLGRGADVEAMDEQKCTALHYAASCHQAGSTYLLLQVGANPMAINQNGRTPLHCAAWAETSGSAVVEMLMSHGVDVNAITHHGQSPLMFAAVTANLSVCEILLQGGASLLYKTPKGEDAITVCTSKNLAAYLEEQKTIQERAHLNLITEPPVAKKRLSRL